MVNDTIVNAKNFSDKLCNEVIHGSNDLAHTLGITYGEIWACITIFVIFMLGLYNAMLLLALYCPKLKRTIKYTYWVTHSLIVLFLFSILIIGVAAP
jgi:hypothetical protein